MAATVTPTKGLNEVIDAMRSIQTESERWTLAEALRALVPTGVAGFSEVVDKATAEGVAGNLSANTLRLYRDTATRWPADKRVADVSFSAHREAMVLPSITEAQRTLTALAKQLGAGKVTVASVRKAVAVKQGKPVPGTPAGGKGNGGGGKAGSSGPTESQALADLKSGGKLLIEMIGQDTSEGDLDKLQAGLTKVIAHVERLRAKAARKQAAASKAAAKKGVANARAAVKKSSTPRTRKAQGDLRGL